MEEEEEEEVEEEEEGEEEARRRGSAAGHNHNHSAHYVWPLGLFYVSRHRILTGRSSTRFLFKALDHLSLH